MKYVNAKDVLPKELVEQLQKYVRGCYIYVPQETGVKRNMANRTEYKIELEKRNEHIYLKHLQKWSHGQISKLYHLSLPSIRRVICEQRKKAGAMEKMIEKVLSFWNISEKNQMIQCHNHVWEIGARYMIKVYDEEETLKRNLKILKVLLNNSVPVSAICTTNDGKDYVAYGGKYYVITEKLSGEHIKDIRKGNTAYQMGASLGQLHLALKKCENELEFWDNSLNEELNGWIKEKFVANEWNIVSESEFEKTSCDLANIYEKLPKQLIHRDVHAGNFLFKNNEFSGYIDFDLSQKNIRIFDLCYFLAGLLTEENGVFMKEDEWLEICKQVVKGYETKMILCDEEKQSMPLVMETIELLFAAYFVSIEDLRCALDAIKVYRHIQNLEDKIYRIV